MIKVETSQTSQTSLTSLTMTRESFVITLRPEPGTAGLQALRLALKTLLRSYGLRCTKIEIVLGDAPPLLKEPLQGDIANVVTHGRKYGDASQKENAAPKRGSRGETM
jgi:hypothetical protein